MTPPADPHRQAAMESQRLHVVAYLVALGGLICVLVYGVLR
ncbi:hypothetical protein ACFV30_01325 [Streptomyces sp. NPDC059752]